LTELHGGKLYSYFVRSEEKGNSAALSIAATGKSARKLLLEAYISKENLGLGMLMSKRRQNKRANSNIGIFSSSCPYVTIRAILSK